MTFKIKYVNIKDLFTQILKVSDFDLGIFYIVHLLNRSMV